MPTDSAPAGFGKTTLLSNWLHSLPPGRARVAWLSLDEGDNEPVLFWRYVPTALYPALPGLCIEMVAYLDAQQALPLRSVLQARINRLRREYVRIRKAHQGTVQSLKMSPEGHTLASCGDDGAIMIWDVQSGEDLRRDRPYERLDISGAKGLTQAQRALLCANLYLVSRTLAGALRCELREQHRDELVVQKEAMHSG